MGDITKKMDKSNLRSKITRTLRWLLSLVLLIVLFKSIDIEAARSTLEHTRPFPIIVALIMLVADRFLWAFRWKLILRPYAENVTFLTVVRITFISSFLAFFLPSAISGDVVRGYFLHKEKADVPAVISTLFLDRLMGFFALLLLSFAGMGWAFLQGFIASDWLILVLIMVGLTVVGIIILISPFTARVMARLKKSKWGLVRQVGMSIEAVRVYPWTVTNFSLVLGFTLLVYVFGIYAAYIVFQAMGGVLPFGFFFLFILIVQIALLIPISVGGLGVHEGAWVIVMGRVGVPASDALLYALLLRIINVLVSLPGGVLYAIHSPQLTTPQASKNEREVTSFTAPGERVITTKREP